MADPLVFGGGKSALGGLRRTLEDWSLSKQTVRRGDHFDGYGPTGGQVWPRREEARRSANYREAREELARRRGGV